MAVSHVCCPVLLEAEGLVITAACTGVSNTVDMFVPCVYIYVYYVQYLLFPLKW